MSPNFLMFNKINYNKYVMRGCREIPFFSSATNGPPLRAYILGLVLDLYMIVLLESL